MTVVGVDTAFSRLLINRENFVGAAITHQSGTNNVKLQPNKFQFPVGTSTVTQFTFENYKTYFNPQQTVGVGSTGTHYTITTTGLGTQAIQTVDCLLYTSDAADE